jgi:hypothetical protein
MKFTPIKCWQVTTKIIDTEVDTQREEDFQILKKSILKRGFRGFLINDRTFVESQEWYRDFLLGIDVWIYIDGSGVYKIVNIDLSENEIYFERLDIPIGYKPWVFFSWQSDSPDIRAEIESTLKEIIEEINKTRNPRQPLELKNSDEPTPGSHNIVEELKKNIDHSLVVVADVTNVAVVDRKDGKEKWVPNPNVVFEMSYSFVKKTNDQVILIRKTGLSGPQDQAPFDYFQNRMNSYSNLTELKEKLTASLTSTLERIGYIVRLN